jgi:hypothetical protein
MKRAALIAGLVAVLAAALPLAAQAGDWSSDLAARFKAVGLAPAPGRKLKVQTGPAGFAVAGVVRGSDPLLAKEYVVVQAEAGAAEALLETARRVHAAAPRRSVLFAVVAPGNADAFAARPPVAREAIVASLGVAGGAATPLVIAGADDSSLGVRAHALALGARLPAASTAGAPSFLQAGTPALDLAFGDIQAAPAYLASLAQQVADSEAHPAWTRGSRYAPPMPRADALVTAPVEMPLGRRPQRNLGDYAMGGAVRAY